MPSLLTLPLEIKERILVLALDHAHIRIYRAKDDQAQAQAHETRTECKYYTDYSKASGQTANSSCVKNAMSLCMACRQLYDELRPTFYKQATTHFVSGHTLTSFVTPNVGGLDQTNTLITWLSTVHIDMGPAKYASADTNKSNHGALKLLANTADRLRTLRLSFIYYHGATSDIVVVRKRTLHDILRFGRLLSLQLQISDPPPGPVGDIRAQEIGGSVQFRMHCLEKVLQNHVCRQSDPANDQPSAGASAARHHKVNFRDEVQALVHDGRFENTFKRTESMKTGRGHQPL